MTIKEKERTPAPATVMLDVVRSRCSKFRTISAHIRDAIIVDCYKSKKPSPAIAKKIYATTRAILTQLYIASTMGDNSCAAIPRDNNLYTTGSRLHALRFSSDITVKVIEWFVANDYAVLYLKGCKFPPDDNDGEAGGYVTCYLPTKKLSDLFVTAHIRLVDILQEADTRALVELRDSEKTPLPLPSDCPIIERSERLLRDYNKLLHESYLDWDEAVAKKPPKAINLCNKSVRRVFNLDTENGGRFYGGWWQHIPQRDSVKQPDGTDKKKKQYRRLFVRINGEIAAEIDFRSIHPVMLYVMEGVDFREYSDFSDGQYDLYKKIKFSGNATLDRNLFKQAILVGINAISPKDTYSALRYEISQDRANYPHFDKLDNTEMKRVYSAIYDAHPSLRGYMGTGMGVKLQYYESLIAERVIETFTYTYKQPVLCMHDSLIVTATMYKKLQETMFQAFNEVMRIMKPSNKVQYEVQDILDIQDSELALISELTRKAPEERLGNEYTEKERMLAEFVGHVFEGKITTPIQLRTETWRKTGNSYPFDRI